MHRTRKVCLHCQTCSLCRPKTYSWKLNLASANTHVQSILGHLSAPSLLLLFMLGLMRPDERLKNHTKCYGGSWHSSRMSCKRCGNLNPRQGLSRCVGKHGNWRLGACSRGCHNKRSLASMPASVIWPSLASIAMVAACYKEDKVQIMPCPSTVLRQVF